jgi:eukaryotic-like serine/threonine-protein kinase
VSQTRTPAPPRNRTARRRRRTGPPPGLRAGLLLAGLAALAFGVGYLLTAVVLFPAGEGDRIVTVPDVRGATLDEARRILAGADLPLERGSVLPHPQTPEGSILAQSPLPGQETVAGTPVRVTISAGAARRTIPNLDGMPAEGAGRALEAAGFTVRFEEVEHERPTGTVLAVQPAPGSQVQLPASVVLRVSSGPPRVEVPDVTGMDQNEARRVLEQAALTVGNVEFNRFSWEPEGTVLAQLPDAGGEAAAGSAVDLVVSGRSRPGVEIPRPGDEGELLPEG